MVYAIRTNYQSLFWQTLLVFFLTSNFWITLSVQYFVRWHALLIFWIKLFCNRRFYQSSHVLFSISYYQFGCIYFQICIQIFAFFLFIHLFFKFIQSASGFKKWYPFVFTNFIGLSSFTANILMWLWVLP